MIAASRCRGAPGSCPAWRRSFRSAALVPGPCTDVYDLPACVIRRAGNLQFTCGSMCLHQCQVNETKIQTNIMKTILSLIAIAAVALSTTSYAGKACEKCCKGKCAECCKDKGKTCGKDCCKED